jgi:hypothetical protein
MAKDSIVPPGLGFIWRAKPAVKTAGYCQPRLRRWGGVVWLPTRMAGKGSFRSAARRVANENSVNDVLPSFQ